MSGWYICSAGETFDSIALRLYGDEGYAQSLLQANPALCSILVFRGGERLKTPAAPKRQGSTAAMSDIAPWRE